MKVEFLQDYSSKKKGDVLIMSKSIGASLKRKGIVKLYEEKKVKEKKTKDKEE